MAKTWLQIQNFGQAAFVSIIVTDTVAGVKAPSQTLLYSQMHINTEYSYAKFKNTIE